MPHLRSFQASWQNGVEHLPAQYRGQLVLIVNVVSRCGFTPHYAGLEALHRAYRDQGVSILAFPCNPFVQQEPQDNAAIKTFCKC